MESEKKDNATLGAHQLQTGTYQITDPYSGLRPPAARIKTPPVYIGRKIGRNDPCPCGATEMRGGEEKRKKYKHCCMK